MSVFLSKLLTNLCNIMCLSASVPVQAHNVNCIRGYVSATPDISPSLTDNNIMATRNQNHPPTNQIISGMHGAMRKQENLLTFFRS